MNERYIKNVFLRELQQQAFNAIEKLYHAYNTKTPENQAKIDKINKALDAIAELNHLFEN